MKMKTILLAISCLIVAALLLASCGSAVTEEEEGKSTTQEEEVVQEPPSTETLAPTTKTTDSGQVTNPSPIPIVNRTTHGRIRWDETWQGEINIIGDIIVEEGFTLTIEPGTKVLIAANSDVDNLLTDPFLLKKGIRQEQPGEDPFYRGIHFGEPYYDEGNHITIRILGTLHAVGTHDQMITITSDSPSPTRYDWNHFQFNHGILSYCIMEDYWALGPGEGTVVSHNILRHVGGCAVCRGSGPALIEYNTISDAGHELIGCGGSSHIIRNNQLGPNYNKAGICMDSPEASPQIIDNTITECGSGIVIPTHLNSIVFNFSSYIGT